MSDSAGSVSVVLPAYDEADTLETTVERTLETLESFLSPDAFEVLIAEDGCSDRTPEIASRLASEDERVRHIHSDQRLGRGGALNVAFREATGQTVGYFDTDLATDLEHLEELVESVRSGEYDVATGSRWLPGQRAERPAKRGVPSRGFNLAVRTLLGSGLRDHQCGFKAIDRDAFLALQDSIEDEHWFWDTELLVRAQRQGYAVNEFGVDWTPKGDTKVDLVRDVFGMGTQILRCWYEFTIRPRATRRAGIVGGSLLTVLALLLMTQYLDPSQVIAEMSAADPMVLALSALVYAVSWPLRGLRYRDILAELGFRERIDFLTGAIFISQTGNLVFPARLGDAVRAYVLKSRRTVPYSTGFASLALERVFDLLTITVLAGAVLLGLAVSSPGQLADIANALTGESGAGQSQSGQLAVVVAAVVGLLAICAVAGIVASARTDRSYIRRFVSSVSEDSYVEYVTSSLERFAGDVQTVASSPAAFARVGASSLLIWGIDVVAAIVVLLAFGVSLPASTLIAVSFFAVSVGNLAKVLPLSPGGIGLYEGAFTVLVVALTGISPALALGAAVVDHAVKNGVTIVGGVISMVVLNVSLTQAVEAQPEPRNATETHGSE